MGTQNQANARPRLTESTYAKSKDRRCSPTKTQKSSRSDQGISRNQQSFVQTRERSLTACRSIRLYWSQTSQTRPTQTLDYPHYCSSATARRNTQILLVHQRDEKGKRAAQPQNALRTCDPRPQHLWRSGKNCARQVE